MLFFSALQARSSDRRFDLNPRPSSGYGSGYENLTLPSAIETMMQGMADVQGDLHGNDSYLSQHTTHPPLSPLPVDPRWIPAEATRLLSPLEYRYALVSRGDTETLIWFIRYTFCGLVVPILLATEVRVELQSEYIVKQFENSM